MSVKVTRTPLGVFSRSDLHVRGSTTPEPALPYNFRGRERHVCFEYDGALYMLGGMQAVSGTDLKNIYSTTDGINWYKAGEFTAGENAPIGGKVNYGGYMWVCVRGELEVVGGYSYYQYDFYKSTDAVTWTYAGGLPEKLYNANADRIFVKFGSLCFSARAGTIWTSSDGATWTKNRDSSLIEVGKSFRNGRFLTGEKQIREITTDPYGYATVVLTDSVQSTMYASVSYGGGYYIICGADPFVPDPFNPGGNRVLYSLDGVIYDEATDDWGIEARANHTLNYYAGYFWVIGGNGLYQSGAGQWYPNVSHVNTIARSADMVNWELVNARMDTVI